MSDLYQEIIIEEFRHPQNRGVMANPTVQWQERNSSCGDEVTVYLKLSDDGQHITDVKWTGEGCAISMSATSFLSQLVKEKSVSAVLALTKKDVENVLGIEEVMTGREKCVMLGLIAIQQAIRTTQPLKAR